MSACAESTGVTDGAPLCPGAKLIGCPIREVEWMLGVVDNLAYGYLADVNCAFPLADVEEGIRLGTDLMVKVGGYYLAA